jgi:hypothetical protein
MKPEDEVLADLKALAESYRGLEAPAGVEANLRSAFRNRGRRRRFLAWRWIPAIAAAAILLIIASYRIASYRRPAPETPRVENVPPVVRRVSADIRAAAPLNRRVARTRKPAAAQEIATEFFPLVEFAPPVDSGELVRVSLPASAMRDVGLPVREDRLADRVQADVFISEGRATAIRFVKYAQ